ncbi:MAG: Stp1/IreP family PP2C-type Ser/Thr phosphatase [Elusimicrobiota bacterium]
MSRLTLDIYGKTDLGCVRERNEDNLIIDETLGLLVVADGMGGHNSGEVASQTAVDTILQCARQMLSGSKIIVPDGDHSRPVRSRQLEYMVQTANMMIFEKGRAFPKDHGMGTTVVAVLLDPKSLTVAHVGDSRLYRHRAGALEQITDDHSLVMDQVRQGLITREQAEHSNLQNILTRALGTEEKVVVDVAEHPVLPGDSFLLCSDGLTKMVSEADTAQALERCRTAQEAVDALIEAARGAGGVDNVTVVIARVREAGGRIGGIFSRLLGRRP